MEKILLIDADKPGADSIYKLLSEKGYNVSRVYNGRDGLAKAKEENFNLVILELLMPDMKGEQLYSQLRRIRGYRNVPIIVLSNKDEIDDIERLFEMGADDYIIKPPRPDYLLDRIAAHLP